MLPQATLCLPERYPSSPPTRGGMRGVDWARGGRGGTPLLPPRLGMGSESRGPSRHHANLKRNKGWLLFEFFFFSITSGTGKKKSRRNWIKVYIAVITLTQKHIENHFVHLCDLIEHRLKSLMYFSMRSIGYAVVAARIGKMFLYIMNTCNLPQSVIPWSEEYMNAVWLSWR